MQDATEYNGTEHDQGQAIFSDVWSGRLLVPRNCAQSKTAKAGPAWHDAFALFHFPLSGFPFLAASLENEMRFILAQECFHSTGSGYYTHLFGCVLRTKGLKWGEARLAFRQR